VFLVDLKSLSWLRRLSGVLWFVFAGALSSGAELNETVAVAPFVNLSQRPSVEWIGVGIAETVISHLEGRGVAATYLRVDAEVEYESTEIGAKWSVTGTYQKVGNDLRISVRIVDNKSGALRRRFRLDGSASDLFQLQDQLLILLDREIVPLFLGTSETNEQSTSAGLVSGRDALVEDASDYPLGDGPVGSRRRTVIRRTTQPPEIDGRLDDPIWTTATHISNFVQIAPVEGAPGTEDTEVWMAYDNENLYFAFYAHYSNTGIMRTNWGDRDETRGDDQMAVLFDPFLDQQRAYQFEVNGRGVQSDSIVNAEGTRSRRSSSSSSMSNSLGSSYWQRTDSSSLSSSGSFGIRGDDSWNALFETSGQIVDDGWTAEMAIPFKSLRYPSRGVGEDHVWGFQITRRIRGLSEAQSWSPISRDIAGQLTQFGVLEGLKDLSQSRNVEILPELTGVSIESLDRTAGNYRSQVSDGEIGVGFKYGITPNLTADLTYNPDFSQIEADRPQIETNQRFALFYPEQRPFFLEGQEIFQTSTPMTLLNTRSIVDPRFGGKVTGKVGNTTLGVIVADDEAAGYLENRKDSRVDMTAQTIVGRVRYDFYSESYLGAIMTAREFGEDFNRVGGVDGRFRLGPTHRLSFMAVSSSTRNSIEGSIGGPAVEIDLTRQGRNFGYSASYGSIDPEFRSETGFLPRVDVRQAIGTVSYRWWPEATLMTWGPSFSYFRLYDHAGKLQDEQIQGQASFQFRNNISLTGTLNRDLERFREVDFRKTGYGLSGVISGRTVSIYGGFSGGDGILFSDNPFLGRMILGNINVSVRPNSRMRVEMTSIFSRFLNPTSDAEVFDVKIFRARTTFQFSRRFLLRHIMEHNTYDVTLGNNVLLTYRINSGTVVFLGYDDRFQRGTRIDRMLFPMRSLQRTNRAVFTKVSYLFRL